MGAGLARVWPALAAALLACPASAQDDGRLRLSPASDWLLDYGEASCSLRRAFGDEAQPVVLELQQRIGGPEIGLTVFGQSLKGSAGEAAYRLQPDAAWTAVANPVALTMENGADGVRFAASLLAPDVAAQSIRAYAEDPSAREREGAIAALDLDGVFENDLTLETGPLAQAMTAMRACTDDLMQTWNVDSSVLDQISRSAEPIDQPMWVRQIIRNYPSEMLRRGEEGQVDVMLLVGADGRVDECIVMRSDAHEGLQKAACDDFKRYGRFEPVHGRDGEPVRSYYFTSITYDS